MTHFILSMLEFFGVDYHINGDYGLPKQSFNLTVLCFPHFGIGCLVVKVAALGSKFIYSGEDQTIHALGSFTVKSLTSHSGHI